MATAGQRVRLLGGSVNNAAPILTVRSPISGTVVEQNTSSGEGIKTIDNTPSLFTISDLSRVWILCDVYENSIGQVHRRDSASVRLNAYPDRILQGYVGDISRVLDPATRSVKVRIELRNPDGILRPGMFASVTFRSAAQTQSLVVPATAVLRLQDKDWVFRRDSANRFRRVEVRAGVSAPDGMQQVQSGLREGDEVIVNSLEFSTTVAASDDAGKGQ